jgi:signal transduction histidine kinase
MFSPVERLARLLRLSQQVRDSSVEGGERVTLDTKSAEVLARVAHEMRQPLAAALAAFHVMRSTSNESARIRSVEILDKQLRSLTRLLDDLTEATRIRISRPSLKLEKIDLRSVVHDVAEAVGSQVREKHHRLQIDLPPSPVWIFGDPQRLQQVVSNLVLNAVRHTSPGGLLQIDLTCPGAQAVLTVSDTGPGIDPAALPHIFKPFTKGAGEGMGIGLDVARQFVELHRGTIRAVSAGPGGGSQFVVTLPTAGRSGPPIVLHH